jgi:hypothetical protein
MSPTAEMTEAYMSTTAAPVAPTPREYHYHPALGRDDSEPTPHYLPPSLHFLWQVVSGVKLELNRPIPVELHFMDGMYSVTSREFDIQGFGRSKQEALSDFMAFFVGDYQNLLKSRERLTEQAQRLLALYEGTVKK